MLDRFRHLVFLSLAAFLFLTWPRAPCIVQTTTPLAASAGKSSLSTFSATNEVTLPQTAITSPASLVKMEPLVGGVGNNLFIFASSFGIAKARNSLLCHDPEQPLHTTKLWKTCDVSLAVPPCPADLSCKRLDEGIEYGKFHPSFMSGTESCVTPVTYLQSFKFWEGQRLPLRLKHTAVARMFLAESKIDACIHVRRTDMLTHGHLATYNEVGYLTNAIAKLKSLHGDSLKFLVASDDPGWVDSQPFLRDMARSPFDDYSQDMALLASCHHLIITIGTFGWWSAFFNGNNGTIIYRPQFMTEQYLYDPDFFPASWTPVHD
jgi:Glycosyl transferase family 11